MFQQHTIVIPERLRAFVREVMSLDPLVDTSRLPIYADGCPGIIFQQTDEKLLLNGQKQLSPIFLYGQTVQPITMGTAGSLRMVLVCFHPHVMHSMFRMNVCEVTDDCVDLDLLPAVPRVNLNEQLWNAVSVDRQVQILFDYIEKVVSRNSAVIDKGMAYATSRLLRADGEFQLKELQRELNMGERTFERRFEQYVGVGPKLYSRIGRFQAALGQLRGGRYEKLSDVAYLNGYADQSHFIRDFKRFTGLSPLAFRKKEGLF
ncbi:MAG TPA: AraC family transcriptional regulator [Puia sp.]